nr:mucin-5AC-like [Halyomorpha halys]
MLQLVSSRRENVAFSPYGVVSVGLVLYEGASGTTAAEIHNTFRLPWDRHITRIGFRDLHRYLKSYFTNDGFLRGLVLSKPNVILHWNYTRQLQFYGFDLKPADTPTKSPSTTQTTPMDQTSKPPTTAEGTSTQTQQPTTVTMQQETEEQPATENASKSPTTTQRTSAFTTDAETMQTGYTSKVPTTTPPTENAVTTNTETQEAEQTSKAPITKPTTIKTETTDEETQQTDEVSMGDQTSPSTTDSITADGNNQQTEEVTRVTQTNSPTTNAVPTSAETQQTEEAPKVTQTTVANTQSEETNTTPKVQTTVSPQTETMATDTTSKSETTMKATDETNVDEMEGRVDSEESPQTTQTKVPTTEALTEKTEAASLSTITPSTSQTLTVNVPETSSTSSPETTRTEVSNEDKTESGATIMSTNPTIPPTTQSSESQSTEGATTESKTGSTVPAQSESAKPETQTATEAITTMAESSPTDTAGTSAGTTTPPNNAETETTNEINTQQTTSDTANDEGISRKRRALLHSKGIAPEHREGVSNWVPHYQDPRWNYHAPLENWFFSYFGGEKVPIITYSAYLPFAYLGDLATLALQLPLDDPRYHMLILLPQERNGLEKLLYSLQWCPIRGIINQLKLTAVYATVPVFTIVKHVNLVPALAKLGILSVFDPSTADLSAMSPEKGIFVRTIEQVVTVSLRKYFANYRWFEAKPNEVEQHFIANHPFAYFVLDKETQVTLMTGTIVNPTAYNQ